MVPTGRSWPFNFNSIHFEIQSPRLASRISGGRWLRGDSTTLDGTDIKRFHHHGEFCGQTATVRHQYKNSDFKFDLKEANIFFHDENEIFLF